MTGLHNDALQWTVLIVDDRIDNLTVAAKILSMNGAVVYTATSGTEGLDLLERLTPNCILLDLSMPKLNGWELLKAIRHNPTTAHIPVIAMTAHTLSSTRDDVFAAGFDGYIAKPFNINTLTGEVRRVMARLAGTD